MSVIAEYKALKLKVESLQREKDRREGAVEQALYALQEEFGCETLKAAKKLLLKIEAERKKHEAEAAKILASIEEKYGDDLRGSRAAD